MTGTKQIAGTAHMMAIAICWSAARLRAPAVPPCAAVCDAWNKPVIYAMIHIVHMAAAAIVARSGRDRGWRGRPVRAGEESADSQHGRDTGDQAHESPDLKLPGPRPRAWQRPFVRNHERSVGAFVDPHANLALLGVEKRGRGTFLQATPIDVSRIIADRLFGKVETAVLTSAMHRTCARPNGSPH